MERKYIFMTWNKMSHLLMLVRKSDKCLRGYLNNLFWYIETMSSLNFKLTQTNSLINSSTTFKVVPKLSNFISLMWTIENQYKIWPNLSKKLMKSMRKNQKNITYSTKKKTKILNRKVEISLIYMNPTQKHRISLT